jgi:hypothetical protein
MELRKVNLRQEMNSWQTLQQSDVDVKDAIPLKDRERDSRQWNEGGGDSKSCQPPGATDCHRRRSPT